MKQWLCFVLLFVSSYVSANFKPQEAFLKVSQRTPSDITAIREDTELRIGALCLDVYNVYALYEREDYITDAQTEWFIGYGGIIELLKKSETKMQLELFDRHRYDANSESIRMFKEISIPGIHLKYGFAMLGRNYENFQPAIFAALNYKKFSCKFELDLKGRLVSNEQFKPSIPLSKTTGVNILIEHRKVDRDFYKVEAVLYYKEAK